MPAGAKNATVKVESARKENIEEVIESITLPDLKERSLELQNENANGYMYHI
jgi:hypothetical protein